MRLQIDTKKSGHDL